MTAGAPLFIDPLTGKFRLPGRVTREIVDTQTLASPALPAWWTLAGGSLGSASWTASTEPGGSLQCTTAATINALTGVRGAAPFATFSPYRYTALALTFEGLKYSADSALTTSMGFYGTSSSKGGCYVAQDTGTSQAYIGVVDSSGTLHKINIQYQFFSGSGAGTARRNLTLLWLPQDGWAYVLEDDQVVAKVDISAYSTLDPVQPNLYLSTATATALTVQFSQSKITLNHN